MEKVLIVQPGCTKPNNHGGKAPWEKWSGISRAGNGTLEPWEIIYFKLYKSQLTVAEKALETAA